MPLRPRIVGVVRKPGGTVIGGVLVDGKAKLAFVKDGKRLLIGTEARIALSKGQWLAAQRIHNLFKSPEVVTVPDGLTVRRLTIIEFPLNDERSEYVVVSQAARRSGGYIERFRRDDPLIGAFYCQYRMDPTTVEIFHYSEEFLNPTYSVLTECAAEARRAVVEEEKHYHGTELPEVMFQAVIQWWPWNHGKDVFMPCVRISAGDAKELSAICLSNPGSGDRSLMDGD